MINSEVFKIVVFTGTRADYGLLKPLIERLLQEKIFNVKILCSGMHLVPEFGSTYKEIENDNIIIDEKIEVILASDTNSAVAKSIGIGIISFSDYLSRTKPHLAIILGDRFEAFAFAVACYTCKIPIAHIHGGEITSGSLDEGYRHAITKMSCLHFTSTEQYRKNVIQLGEQPSMVYNVGALSLDNIKNLKLLSKNEVENKIGKKFKKYNFLITYHPTILENISVEEQIDHLLCALDEISFTDDYLFIFTASNADANGKLVNSKISNYVSKNSYKSVMIHSLGRELYLNTLRFVDVVVGNSSSGIIEVPFFKIPTVNIGNRQKGRIKCKSIIDCDYECNSIKKAINLALSKDFKDSIKNIDNPYGDGTASSKIVEIIKYFFCNLQNLNPLIKEFYKINF